MPSVLSIDFIDLVLRGLLIGIIASAPMGPVGVLCVQRTLNKGRWFGMVTGVGAAVSDIIYACVTGFGMSFVMDLITSHQNKFFLQILGSVVLMIFGVICFRSDPTKKIHRSGKPKGSLMHNCITGFLVTFSNPLIVFLFMGCFAQFAFVIPDHPIGMCVGFISIFLGALVWWYGLTWLIDMVRDKFSDDGILIINRVIGSIVILFSLFMLIGTVFNLYALPF